MRLSSGYHETRARMSKVTHDWANIVRESDKLIRLGRVDAAKRLLNTAAEEFSGKWDHDGVREIRTRFARMGDTEKAEELLSLAQRLEQIKKYP